MARGFLSGAIWGAVFSGAGLAAISLNAPLPDGAEIVPPAGGAVDSSLLTETPDATPDSEPPLPADPPVAEVDDPAPEASAPLVVVAPENGEVAKPKPDLSQPGRRPEPESGVDRPIAPAVAPAAPSGPVAVGADTAPLAPPRVSDAPDAPEGVTPEPASAPPVLGRDAPVKPGAKAAAAPGAPRPEAQPVIVTGPAQPPAPAVPGGDSALVTERVDVAPADPDADPILPAETPEPEPEVAAPVAVEPVPEPAAPVATLDDPEPEPEPETPDASGPGIGKPARSLVTRAPEPVLDPEPQETGPAAQPAAFAALPEDSPLVRFATPVDVSPEVPRMAVVLIDDGSGPLGPSGLEAFPFPISFAIAPTHPDAANAAKGYRDLGFEVLVLGDMPDGATAADVEVAMQGLMGAVPQAVAVLEDPEGGLQDNREVSAQVAAFLASSGHGLITQPKGLNTAQKLALKDGVPSVTLFRDFDGEGQDATMIRRTLDQAALRARQDSGVVMMGRLRADTISALVLWGLQDRSGSIALVPVSVVLAESLATD
ncbi:divergent polysaccharide deacetylase family protein [Mameliella alba]|nr:divergent polysaccharide deacetylase family protein [Antarctobacter heliothermus]MBY6144305.1 divergent polysaccharide deacetylase family protein [Mameliella alba]MCA0954354.1 divergent polysaccharide deacetylase family protein [Mameliella alba]